MGLLKSLFETRHKPEPKRFKDYNEYLWELARQEKKRVMAKRAPYEKTWEERMEEWQRKQVAQLARQIDRLDKAGQLSRASPIAAH